MYSLAEASEVHLKRRGRERRTSGASSRLSVLVAGGRGSDGFVWFVD